MKFSLVLSTCLSLVADTFAQTYWYETISHQGVAPYNPQGTAYQVYRNVKSFGAKGFVSSTGQLLRLTNMSPEMALLMIPPQSIPRFRADHDAYPAS